MRIKIALLALGSALYGDTLELKTGERIDGTFKRADSAGAVIEVAGQPVTVPIAKMRAVYWGSPPPPPPASPVPASDALDALKGLRSVTSSGVAYRDYATRVLDARVRVDRSLPSIPPGEAGPRVSIQTAMREYEIASSAWNLEVNGMGWLSSLTPDLIQRCPQAGRIIRKDKKDADILRALVDFGIWDSVRKELSVDGMSVQQVMWACASQEIAIADGH